MNLPSFCSRGTVCTLPRPMILESAIWSSTSSSVTTKPSRSASLARSSRSISLSMTVSLRRSRLAIWGGIWAPPASMKPYRKVFWVMVSPATCAA